MISNFITRSLQHLPKCHLDMNSDGCFIDSNQRISYRPGWILLWLFGLGFGAIRLCAAILSMLGRFLQLCWRFIVLSTDRFRGWQWLTITINWFWPWRKADWTKYVGRFCVSCVTRICPVQFRMHNGRSGNLYRKHALQHISIGTGRLLRIRTKRNRKTLFYWCLGRAQSKQPVLHP